MKRSLCALVIELGVATGQPLMPIAAAPSRSPTLVVILVVDQMAADYVERFGHHWTGGFRRLMDEGAWFRAAACPYLTTLTCAGHATIATGSLPSTHGIIGNQWWDREAGKAVACAADPEADIVSYGGPAEGRQGTSARNVEVPAFPDELRLQSSVAPRVVALSLKDVTATMLAGRRPDVALWFDDRARAFVTSSAFGRSRVRLVEQFVNSHPIEASVGTVWAKLLPESAYRYDDDATAERPPEGATNRFPHPLGGKADAGFYARWEGSPAADQYLAELAVASIDALALGKGPGTDYLAISFSALDAVGHAYGPRSHEVQDVLARLDRTLGSLIARLDRRVGRDRYVLSLSGDHGVAPVPEQVTSLGLPGGRIAVSDVVRRVEAALQLPLGAGTHVARMNGADVYFAPGVFAQLQANPAAMRAAIDAILATPGVMRVFRSDDVARAFAPPHDDIERAVRNTYYAKRSGDLIVVAKPYWIFSMASATTHGSPHGYDQRIPLFLFGGGIARGVYGTASGPMDIAPTFARLTGLTLPRADGRVLDEALTPVSAPGAQRPTGGRPPRF